MASELEVVRMDAVLKARKVARQADLLAQARGKWTWKSVVGGVLILGLATWFWRRTNISQEVFYAMTILFLGACWSEERTSHRLDAIVRLLEEPRDA
jgi:hypothetical protein